MARTEPPQQRQGGARPPGARAPPSIPPPSKPAVKTKRAPGPLLPRTPRCQNRPAPNTIPEATLERQRRVRLTVRLHPQCLVSQPACACVTRSGLHAARNKQITSFNLIRRSRSSHTTSSSISRLLAFLAHLFDFTIAGIPRTPDTTACNTRPRKISSG